MNNYFVEVSVTYRSAVLRLSRAGIEGAPLEARLLFEHFCALSATELMFRRDEDFSSSELESAISRREAREPLQYILGEWEFFGLPFSLNADTLIPRPDTETVVEQAIKLLPRGARFCDIGTGSGAIAVSILHARPDTSAVAVDINENALAAALQNARANGVADRFTPRLDDALSPSFLSGERFDAIISNPPYIASAEVDALAPELAFEPRRALDGGEDGYDFYHALTRRAADLLGDGGFVLYEVGAGMAQSVCELGRALGYTAEVFPDLSGSACL
jgi:release factor glutamine methyltransferase